MAGPADLTRLLRMLRTASSPLARMKLLAKAWKTVRTLDSAERRDLASRVGFDGAEELIERLASGRGGLKSAFLLSTLEKIRGTSSAELRTVIDGLRDPEERKSVVRKTLDSLSDSLANETPASDDETGPPGGAAPAEPAGGDTGSTSVSPRPETAAVSTANTAAEERPTGEARSTARRLATATGVVTAGATAASTAPGLAATPVGSPVRKPLDVGEPWFTTPPEPPPTITTATASRPKRATETNVDLGLEEQLRETAGLTARFRVIRTRVDEARSLDLEALCDVLECFPPEWARRRVLSALLAERIPGDLQHAIFLVETLASRSARRWCVATLLHTWPLSDHEKEVLTERHGSYARRHRKRPGAA